MFPYILQLAHVLMNIIQSKYLIFYTVYVTIFISLVYGVSKQWRK